MQEMRGGDVSKSFDTPKTKNVYATWDLTSEVGCKASLSVPRGARLDSCRWEALDGASVESDYSRMDKVPHLATRWAKSVPTLVVRWLERYIVLNWQ